MFSIWSSLKAKEVLTIQIELFRSHITELDLFLESDLLFALDSSGDELRTTSLSPLPSIHMDRQPNQNVLMRKDIRWVPSLENIISVELGPVWTSIR